MRFQKTALEGAWVIEPDPLTDERGFFARTFCVRAFGEKGLEPIFVQHSISYSRQAGTLRGMHYQGEPYAEVKLVSCMRGAICDVIVDLRQYSRTFRKWASFELSAENRQLLYVPKGFAHGFLTLSDEVTVSYLISEFHTPSAARGLRYDDPAIGIEWPSPPSIVSEKDLSWPYLSAQAV
ncbi:dTDP-4-dehydrorhamnose 3,5-epimerase [Chelativorans sp. YIM 93263]|uniref:dTDP-4-dehydrorhamnose 3,5-epimerase n=1 Tax=Chelativorans sp. YIM 93263 TaxID=2906648 RepID=UPI0023795317|nr:dTDP-4-dehydrorhamnose 3,5-epimerase [Chelativorans sp. YIM 93263]